MYIKYLNILYRCIKIKLRQKKTDYIRITKKKSYEEKKFEAISNPILTNINGLKASTQSGRENAVKIGIAAGARVQIGKSVRRNV